MITTSDFSMVLKFVLAAASKDVTRANLVAVRAEFSDGMLQLVATSGIRLHCATLLDENFSEAMGAFNLDRYDVEQAVRAVKPIKGDKTALNLTGTNEGLQWFAHNATVILSTKDIQYPRWKDVMPVGKPQPTDTFGIDVDYLAGTCKELKAASGTPHLQIDLFGPHNALRITPCYRKGKEHIGLEAIIMPVRL